MAYTRGFTIELAKKIAASMLKIVTLDALDNSSPMKSFIAQGKTVRTETAVTINNVTDNFLSM